MAASPQRRAIPAGTHDRLFYSGMAILMAVVVFIGFAPTYYLRSVFGTPQTVTGAATLTPLAVLHGAVFTAWVVLFVAQTALVASHRVPLHRKLGVAGALLGTVMIGIGSVTAIRAAARGSAPPGVDPLAFLAIPLGDMVVFAVLLGAALWMRRDKEAHKRLMLLAYVAILVAAVARVPGVLALGPLGFFGFTFVTALALGMGYDLYSRRRVHPVYLWGGALLILSVPLRLFVSTTSAWYALAERLIAM